MFNYSRVIFIFVLISYRRRNKSTTRLKYLFSDYNIIKCYTNIYIYKLTVLKEIVTMPLFINQILCSCYYISTVVVTQTSIYFQRRNNSGSNLFLNLYIIPLRFICGHEKKNDKRYRTLTDRELFRLMVAKIMFPLFLIVFTRLNELRKYVYSCF